MILEEPTQWPLVYAVFLKGPVKYADKARHGDLMVQKKKKDIKIFPAAEKKKIHVNISSESLENP